MNSPTHRANIEKAQYTEVGTGVATGMLDGVETVFVAQVYAKPAPKVVEEPVVVAAAPVEAEPVAISEPVPAESAQVLGASTFVERAAASPRHTANAILLVIAALFGVVLIITLFVWMTKDKVPHYDLVTNGLLIIVVIGAFYVFNVWFSSNGKDLQTSFTSFTASTTADSLTR